MAPDRNDNGIDDDNEVTFDKKHALRLLVIGALAGAVLGGLVTRLTVAVFPDAAAVNAFADWFAGGVCEPHKERAEALERRMVCFETIAKERQLGDVCQ